MLNVRTLPFRRLQVTFGDFSPKTLVALFLVYFVWGSTYLGVRIAVETIPPFMMTAARFFVAGSLIFTYMRWRGAPMPTPVQWRNAFIIGSLMMGGGVGGVSFAEQWISSSLAALVGATIPLWAAFFATFVERKPSRMEMLGIFIGVIGVGFLSLGDDLWVKSIGAVVILLAPLCWGLGSILSRHLSLPGGLMNSAIIMLGGSVTLTVLSLLTGEHLDSVPPTKALLSMAYLTVFGSIITFSAYSYLIQKVQPTVATSYAYVNPVVAGVLGWLVLDEHLSSLTLVAAVFILVAVVIITTQKAERNPQTVVKPRDVA